MFALLALLACTPPPETAADCIPTTGDNCSCTPQCLTQAELDKIDSHCDLGCIFDSGSSELNWTCAEEDGVCVVVE